MNCAEFGFKAPRPPKGVHESAHKQYLLLPKSVSDHLHQKQRRRWRSGDWPLSKAPPFYTLTEKSKGRGSVVCCHLAVSQVGQVATSTPHLSGTQPHLSGRQARIREKAKLPPVAPR